LEDNSWGWEFGVYRELKKLRAKKGQYGYIEIFNEDLKGEKIILASGTVTLFKLHNDEPFAIRDDHISIQLSLGDRTLNQKRKSSDNGSDQLTKGQGLTDIASSDIKTQNATNEKSSSLTEIKKDILSSQMLSNSTTDVVSKSARVRIANSSTNVSKLASKNSVNSLRSSKEIVSSNNKLSNKLGSSICLTDSKSELDSDASEKVPELCMRFYKCSKDFKPQMYFCNNLDKRF
jgi:hypothetical protein